MFERRSALLRTISGLLDLALTALSFPLAYWVRLRLLTPVVGSDVVHPIIYPFWTYWPLFVAIVGIWFLSGYFLSIYRDIELRSPIAILNSAAVSSSSEM